MWKSSKSKGNFFLFIFFLFILKSKNFKQFSQSKIANVRYRICGRTDRLITTDSNMTSFFCFVNKQAIYWLGIISLAHALVHVTDFPVVNVPSRKIRCWSQNHSAHLIAKYIFPLLPQYCRDRSLETSFSWSSSPKITLISAIVYKFVWMKHVL
jgi:hypothetical protein